MRDRKYKYLYQLMLTSIILVIVPVLLFYSIVWIKAISEIDYVNNEYHKNALVSFFGYFTNEVTEFKKQIIEFSAKSRTSQLDEDVFYQGTKLMEEKTYYYGEAAQSLAHYGQQVGYGSIGIYYYEKDLLLTNGIKYTLSRFFKDGLGLSDEKRESVFDFFSLDEFENRKILLAPLYDEEGVCRECLVGVCTFLGKDKEKALMFYSMDYIDSGYFGLILRGTQSKYYVVDNDSLEIVLAVGASREDYDKIQTVLKSSEPGELIEETEYFVKRNKNMDITFLMDVSDDSVQNKVLELYTSVRFFFAYILLIMISICFVIVYLNYKPLQELLKKIEHKGKSEFDAILSAWEKQNDLLEEQRMSIMDLLMNHLIYGMPISHRYTEKLGVSSDISKYFVFIITNYVLKVAEMEELTQKVEELFGVLIFANDLMGENSTVCIAFMEKDKAEMIREWVSVWCQSHIEEEYTLRTGCTVDRLSDIQKSFAECTAIGEKIATPSGSEITGLESLSEKVRKRIVINEKLKEKILNYLDEKFMDRELSQQQVADRFEISVYSLSKMFNNQIGTGFVEYINSKRIEYAKELLLTTEKNVKEIAFLVGFSNSKYFTEIFKKYTGVTPVEFRE
ncbi:MAG: helix-turn-helix transcriptional regulator [Lachnospiraceae bacterium]|nr:helix-turn-helix transcriptional regulator [Lachnospiraceae bacterium]